MRQDDAQTRRAPIRTTTLRTMQLERKRIVAVSVYDAIFARMAEEAGVDVLLVGDSLGMVVQGAATTLGVTLDEMIYHAKAVVRATSRVHVVVDLPFLTYQVSPEQAIESAGRVLKESGAHAIKMEGGRSIAASIRRVVDAGIPVMGHVGLTPQHVHKFGGFRLQGRSLAEADAIAEDARQVEEAGAYATVLEGLPAALAARISETSNIPTIGIGAGPHCSGQVLVSYDLLGLTPEGVPSFVRQYESFYARGVQAMQRFSAETREGQFPEGTSHPPP